MAETMIDVASNQQGETPAEVAGEERSPAQDILDKHTASEEPAGKTEPSEDGESGSDEGVEGDEDALYAGKYKTVPDLEKAFKSLRQELGERPAAVEVPEAYEVSLPDEDVFKDIDIPEDDPMIASFKEVAKDMGLSQENFNTLVAMKIQADIDSAPNLEEEIKSLGKDGAALVKGVENFYKSKLSEEAFSTLSEVMSTASVAKLFDEIRGFSNSVKIPKEPGDPAKTVTPEDAEKAVHIASEAEKAYAPNAKALRKKAQEMMKIAYPD